MKKKIVAVVAVVAVCVILAPVIICYALRQFAARMVDAMDWVAEGRAWSGWLVDHSERVVKWSKR